MIFKKLMIYNNNYKMINKINKLFIKLVNNYNQMKKKHKL